MATIAPAPATYVPFGAYVAAQQEAGRLVVQPRMGFSNPATMRRGLERTKAAAATTVGTLTLDSYTRVGDTEAAARALAGGVPLNGYPIVTLGAERTRALLDGVADRTFPVQVRHGSARPNDIVATMAATGLDATEGGPVSYCLPYSRTPLREAVAHWQRSCHDLAALRDTGRTPHLESFGGCMLGQLCPPGMLVAISVLEAMFFVQHGITSVSLSYAQQTSTEQDREAVWALRALAAELLGGVDWHVVVYAYMGVFPSSPDGAGRLLAAAARLAVEAGAGRLIVKTTAEAHRIPTIPENVAALEFADGVAARTAPLRPIAACDNPVYLEARELVHAVLALDERLSVSLPLAFAKGVLDIPYCLHPDNAGGTSTRIDDDGRLQWSSTGRLPLRLTASITPSGRLTSATLVAALTHVQRTFDAPATVGHRAPTQPTRSR